MLQSPTTGPVWGPTDTGWRTWATWRPRPLVSSLWLEITTTHAPVLACPRPSHLRPEALPHCSAAEGLKDRQSHQCPHPVTPTVTAYPARCPAHDLNPNNPRLSLLSLSTKARQAFQPGDCWGEEDPDPSSQPHGRTHSAGEGQCMTKGDFFSPCFSSLLPGHHRVNRPPLPFASAGM